jgi:hypothetical protein
MILSAFGVTDYTPIEFSEILKRLNISHTLAFYAGTRYTQIDIDGLCSVQPAWPVIIDRIRCIPKISVEKDRLIYFVLDVKEQISLCNFQHDLLDISPNRFEAQLKKVLNHSIKNTEEWSFVTKDHSILDYIEKATKPSFINELLTRIYKITPYSLRKEIQISILSYLAGNLAQTTLKTQLKQSLKSEELLQLMISDKAKGLRDAIKRIKEEPLEKVAQETGFEPFELRYVIRSSEKRQEN